MKREYHPPGLITLDQPPKLEFRTVDICSRPREKFWLSPRPVRAAADREMITIRSVIDLHGQWQKG
jgi:hypothetical protein